MYKRQLDLSGLLTERSVFLFGPRQTGKTTLVRDRGRELRCTMRSARVVFGFLLLSAVAAAQQYVISTYAGGAGPPAPLSARGVNVPIGVPRAIAADATGNVYFAMFDSSSVFKLDPNGVLTRVAGDSPPGYSGDGGPATRARLMLNGQGQGLAADGGGNLFIADTGNHRVRRVSPDGIIVTVAGTGATGFSGDGGPATSAQLGQPAGVAVDGAGNLFVAAGNRIRKVSTSGIITTVAGGGTLQGSSGDGGPATSAQLAFPGAVTVDGGGNLFIADSGNSRIRKVSPSGIISTVAGNDTRAYGVGGGDSGPATSVSLDWPSGVAVDGAGNLFISDAVFPRIRKVSPSGMLTTAAGTASGFSGDGGPATSAQLSGPRGVAVDATGNLFVADSANNRIRRVSAGGIITTLAGDGTSPSFFSGDGGPATNAQMRLAGFTSAGVAVDGAGNLFIADTSNHRIRKVSPTGTITTVAGVGARCGPIDCLPLGDGGPATSAALWYPTSVAVDGAGSLFIAEYGRTRKVSPNGIITTLALDAGALAVDRAGNVFIANGAVRKVSPEGIITTVAGGGRGCEEGGVNCGPLGDGGPATSARLYATGVAVDSSGNLFIADNEEYELFCDRRIRKVSTSGIITTVAGDRGCGFSGDGGPAANAQLDHTHSVTVDGAGNLFLTSIYNSRVRRISADGMIATVAGNGWGFSGDGGPATGAAFTYPGGVAVDSAGNVYVADLASNVIRILRPLDKSVFLGAVVDAASQRADAVSPGKIVVLYGVGLGPSQLIQNQPGGTTVSFNGIAAPILYTSATQVAAVVPYAVTGTTAQVTVAYLGQVSAAFTVPVAASAPSLFTLNQAGWGQAAAINADGTPNTAANAVRIGGFISLYATGEGQTEPTTPPRPVLPVRVTVGGIPASVQYAGGAPGQVAGLMQVNVQIPKGAQPGGYVPVVLQVGDRTSGPAVWIAVAN